MAKSLLYLLLLAFTLVTVSVKIQQAFSRAVIVGGGPIGLISAIALHEIGWSNITVIESRPLSKFEYSKSYVYSVDKRGQRIFKELDILPDLREKSTPFVVIDSKIRIFPPSGKEVIRSLPVKPVDPFDRLSLPRYLLLEMLVKKIEEVNFICNERGQLPPIDMLFGYTCGSITMNGNHKLQLSVSSDEKKIVVEADLLLGCDGINSVVRQWLQSAPSAMEHSNVLAPNFLFPGATHFQSPLTAAKVKFSNRKYNVESAGLKYKFLSFNLTEPTIPIINAEDKQVRKETLRSQDFYSFRGTIPSPLSIPFFTNRPSIGLLPIKAGATKRMINFISKPEDALWRIDNGQDMLQFLQTRFPQVEWMSFIDREELDRFAAAKPGTFPQPQHVQGLQVVFYPPPITTASAVRTSTNEATAAVVLVGDAVHVFPPELGQGVNAGFEDVRVLYDSLATHADSIEDALVNYEQKQLPEAQAICRLIEVGDPQQYRQDPVRHQIRLFFTLLRLGMNKLLPGIVTPPVFFMIINQLTLTYAQFWEKRVESNRKIMALLAVVTAILTRKFWVPAVSIVAAKVLAVTGPLLSYHFLRYMK